MDTSDPRPAPSKPDPIPDPLPSSMGISPAPDQQPSSTPVPNVCTSAVPEPVSSNFTDVCVPDLHPSSILTASVFSVTTPCQQPSSEVPVTVPNTVSLEETANPIAEVEASMETMEISNTPETEHCVQSKNIKKAPKIDRKDKFKPIAISRDERADISERRKRNKKADKLAKARMRPAFTVSPPATLAAMCPVQAAEAAKKNLSGDAGYSPTFVEQLIEKADASHVKTKQTIAEGWDSSDEVAFDDFFGAGDDSMPAEKAAGPNTETESCDSNKLVGKPNGENDECFAHLFEEIDYLEQKLKADVAREIDAVDSET